MWVKPKGVSAAPPPVPVPANYHLPKEKIPAPPYIALAILAVLLFACALVGVFVWTLGVPYPWAGLLGVLAFLGLVRLALPILSGDYPLVRARKFQHIERMSELENEAAAIEATRTVSLAQVQAWHEVEDRDIDARTRQDAEILRLKQRMQAIEARRSTERVPADTWVASKPAPAVQAVHDWLDKVYLPDGAPNPDEVRRESCYLVHAAPWNGEWKGKEWADEARTLLLRRGVVDKVAGGYKLNVDGYPTKASAVKVVGGGG